MQKAFYLSFFSTYFSSACFALTVSYSLPANDSFSAVLKSQLKIYRQSRSQSLMMTDFGLRIHSALVTLDKSYVQKDAVIDLANFEPDSDDLYIQTIGSSVFYNTRSNYLMRLKVKDGQNELKLPLSSLQFGSTNQEVTEVRYDLFIADDSIYPLTESDIRDSKTNTLENYISQYTRQDINFGESEATQKGLKKIQIAGKNTGLNSGYIFSACIVFKDQNLKEQQTEVGECQAYSLKERNSLLPVIPGQKLRSATSYLYLIERHQRFKTSEAVEKSWIKLSIPPNSFVSLEKSTWRALDR